VTGSSSPHETPHRPLRHWVPQPIDDPAPPELPPDSGYRPPDPPPRDRTLDVVAFAGAVVIAILSLYIRVSVKTLIHQDPAPPTVPQGRVFWQVPLALLQRIGRPDGFADSLPRWMGSNPEAGYTMDCPGGTCPRDPLGTVADWARAVGDPIFTREYLAACISTRCQSWFLRDGHTVDVYLGHQPTWYLLVVTVHAA